MCLHAHTVVSVCHMCCMADAAPHTLECLWAPPARAGAHHRTTTCEQPWAMQPSPTQQPHPTHQSRAPLTLTPPTPTRVKHLVLLLHAQCRVQWQHNPAAAAEVGCAHGEARERMARACWWGQARTSSSLQGTWPSSGGTPSRPLTTCPVRSAPTPTACCRAHSTPTCATPPACSPLVLSRVQPQRPSQRRDVRHPRHKYE